MIKTYRFGPGEGTPLLIVHGLFGSARNWGAIAKRLAADRPVLTVDLRNHGDSDWTPTHGFEEMAEDLAEVLEANGGRADVLGHSMGGKAVMRLALTRPELVNHLIVADIAPVAYHHTQLPLVHAMQGLDLSDLTRRSEADERFAREVDDPAVRAFLLQSLDLKTEPPHWKLNLDVLEREMPRILNWPAIDATFGGPTLFLSAEKSDYVRPEYHAEMKRLFPSAKFVRIPGAGHWLHADKPREFIAAVKAFLLT